jgi:hypothetical protein
VVGLQVRLAAWDPETGHRRQQGVVWLGEGRLEVLQSGHNGRETKQALSRYKSRRD